GKLPFAAAGYGASAHLAGELLKRRAGVDMPFVNYKGDVQAITDVAGGQVNIGIVTLVSATQLIKAGRVRAIAIMGSGRVSSLPDVPTVSEAGLSGFSGDAWGGLSVRSGTPPAIIRRINEALVAALDDVAVRDSMPQLGVSPVGSSPESFAEFLRVENDKWTRTISEAKLKLE
ncbi:MAG: tripartite tricarboxylate transporter substrate-binding protein, partial [Desulfobacterales bacterium]|nr:tripartite tricarboxylate transporter substrate-binding protein [Desulfobacterales bacterium]